MSEELSYEERVSANIDRALDDGRHDDALRLAANTAVLSSTTGLLAPGTPCFGAQPPSIVRLYDLLRVAEMRAPGQNQHLFDATLEMVVQIRGQELHRLRRRSEVEPARTLPEDVDLSEGFDHYLEQVTDTSDAGWAIAAGHWDEAVKLEAFGPDLAPVVTSAIDHIAIAVEEKVTRLIAEQASLAEAAAGPGRSSVG